MSYFIAYLMQIVFLMNKYLIFKSILTFNFILVSFMFLTRFLNDVEVFSIYSWYFFSKSVFLKLKQMSLEMLILYT